MPRERGAVWSACAPGFVSVIDGIGDEGRTVGPLVECSGDYQTGDGEGEKTGCCLGDDDIEMLFHAVDAAEEETHAHDEE